MYQYLILIGLWASQDATLSYTLTESRATYPTTTPTPSFAKPNPVTTYPYEFNGSTTQLQQVFQTAHRADVHQFPAVRKRFPRTHYSRFPGLIGGGGVGGAVQRHSMVWHVGVYAKRFTPYMQICGGTLVTTKAVISAAHCFWDDEDALPAEEFAVGAGKRFRPWDDTKDENSQQSNVAAIHIPVRYRDSATSYQDDIAVLLLPQEFRITYAVRPVCVNFDEKLDNEQLKEGNVGTILGWGLTEEDGNPSQVLNYLELPVAGIEECLRNARATGFVRYITSDKICAGVTTGRPLALCRGDSGGGLVFTHEGVDRIPYLRGVASTAPNNQHRCNARALAALTHVRAHRDFLRRYIPNLEDECKKMFPGKNSLENRFGSDSCSCTVPANSTGL